MESNNYKPGERFSAEMSPAAPDRKTIVCRDCALKRPGFMGETADFCEIYASGQGKPYAILFQNAPCQFHTPEAKAAD